MSPSQSARYDAGKEFRRSRYVSKKPWLSPTPKEPMAVISIEYHVTDGEDQDAVLHTWAAGRTAESAFKTWKEGRRARGATFAIVTEPKKNEYEPVGPLGEPTIDTITEYLATG